MAVPKTQSPETDTIHRGDLRQGGAGLPPVMEDSAARPNFSPDVSPFSPLPVKKVLGSAGLAAAQRIAKAPNRSWRPAQPAKQPLIDPMQDKPDLRLIHQLGHRACLRHGLLPWRKLGGQVIVLTARPDLFDQQLDMLRVLFGPVRMGQARPERIEQCLTLHCGPSLMRDAEQRIPARDSCRDWNRRTARNTGLAIGVLVLGLALLWPGATFLVLAGWAVLTLLASIGLKLSCLVQFRRARKIAQVHPAAPLPAPLQLPVISLLVPLFREQDITTHLIGKLQLLDYPADRLDICLVLEEDDLTTRDTLLRTALPGTMRTIVVPVGTLRTKPRALNYALCFARGSVIGVYDAEDAPDPDQLRIVAAQFDRLGSNVACLQGRLDFYNAGTNWLSRCFALEYAAWFRVMLPGLARLGLPVPLGGTTLFFRRDILERIGGWDAHNVTEDADLGLRLARHGYRTELIDTTTGEEANCRAWPWVKQRSRWLKGYAITYGVHMRNPARLWRDLGGRGFFGVQLVFLATLTQFLLAPLLWSFWLVAFGLPHPLIGMLPSWVFWGLGGTFLAAEILNISVAVIAVRSAGKSWLAKWAPSLHLYFPLGALAAWKGILELGWRPFYWDKTSHGQFHQLGRI